MKSDRKKYSFVKRGGPLKRRKVAILVRGGLREAH